MKRTTLMAMLSLLLGISGAHGQTSRSNKTYEGTYNLTAPGACGANSCAYYYDCKDAKSGCALVVFDRPVNKVRIRVIDQTGLPVLARVYTLGNAKPLAKECSNPDDPFTINAHGATELLVHIVAGACEDNTPSTPTQGVVSATVI